MSLSSLYTKGPISDATMIRAGASSGIGRATALEFAKRGASLVLGSRGEEVGAALVKELGDTRAVFLRTDVSVEADARALVDLALGRFGRLDIAVNNAALEARGPIEAFDEATYDRVFDVNVRGIDPVPDLHPRACE